MTNATNICARKLETNSAMNEYRPQSENVNTLINTNEAAANMAPKKEQAKLAAPLEFS